MLESMGDEIYIHRRTEKLHFCLFLFLFVCFLTFLTVFFALKIQDMPVFYSLEGSEDIWRTC